ITLHSGSGLATGDKVTFPGAEGTGLTDKTSYFAHVDGNKISLYDSADHAKAGGTGGRADLTEAKEPSGAYTLTAGGGGGTGVGSSVAVNVAAIHNNATIGNAKVT